MRRLLSTATRPRLQVWIAGLSLALWMALSPVTMLSGLRSSLAWITFASLFANVATCFGWWVSSLVNVRAERIDDRSSEVATVGHIEALEESHGALLRAIAEAHGIDVEP